jgi:heme ABC exporter ATP-binding subunit CcmA
MAEREIAIRTLDVCKDYGHRAVLRQINLQVSRGQCVALTGKNGAGKTTLLRCLASAIRPTTGSVHWFGKPVGFDPRLRRLIGMVAHETRLYPHLTLWENLLFTARMYGVNDALRRVGQALNEIDLARHADRLPSQISRGMRQRVALARALTYDAPVLLLDEPFSGLDAGSSEWFTERLNQLRAKGRTICFSTHDQTKAVRLADTMFDLRLGQLHDVTSVDQSPETGESGRRRAG